MSGALSGVRLTTWLLTGGSAIAGGALRLALGKGAAWATAKKPSELTSSMTTATEMASAVNLLDLEAGQRRKRFGLRVHGSGAARVHIALRGFDLRLLGFHLGAEIGLPGARIGASGGCLVFRARLHGGQLARQALVFGLRPMVALRAFPAVGAGLRPVHGRKADARNQRGAGAHDPEKDARRLLQPCRREAA